jgi:plasmid maintenance system antidote protein VapI
MKNDTKSTRDTKDTIGVPGGGVTPSEFERAFVQIVADEIERHPHLDHSKFARLVWGDSAGSVERWRRIRNKSKAGKPQNLTMATAMMLAQTLGFSFPDFSWRVSKEIQLWREMEERQKLSQAKSLDPSQVKVEKLKEKLDPQNG